MKFRDVAINQRFKFVWSGYVGVKISARKYRLEDIAQLRPHGYPRGNAGAVCEVGTIHVEVTAHEHEADATI